MSMRLVKQQLAALSSKRCAERSGNGANEKIAKTDRKKRKGKKQSTSAVKKNIKESPKCLSEAEIRKQNLEYLRDSVPAEGSVDLMNKVQPTTPAALLPTFYVSTEAL